MTYFWGDVNRNSFSSLFSFSHHYMFRPVQTIFRWNIHNLFKTITPPTDPFLGYTVYYFILCYVMYKLKFDVKIIDNVLKKLLYIKMLSY
jgi:hypothetical protein